MKSSDVDMSNLDMSNIEISHSRTVWVCKECQEEFGSTPPPAICAHCKAKGSFINVSFVNMSIAHQVQQEGCSHPEVGYEMHTVDKAKVYTVFCRACSVSMKLPRYMEIVVR